MTDFLQVESAAATGEGPDQHLANGIQILWKIRDAVEELTRDLAGDFADCERRLMVALTQLRQGQRLAEVHHVEPAHICGELEGED